MVKGPEPRARTGHGSALGDRDALRALLRQPYAARVLLSAVELGLFEPCVPGPASASEVARACRTDPRATGVMLEALVAMGLLERCPQGFSASPVVARHLVQSAPQPLHGMVYHYLHQWQRWSQLSEVVRSGQALPREGQPRRVHRDFVHAMDDNKAHLSVASMLPIPLDGLRRVVDLGGGPGTLAVALVRASPELQVTLVDLPRTISIAAERVPAELWGSRVIPVEADLRGEDPIGEGYDLAVLSAVLHAHSTQDAAWMVGRAARCLRPGGRLVIRELILDDPDLHRAMDAAIFSVSLLINTLQGRSFRQEELLGWMRAAGLEDIELLAVERGSALVGRRP
jgi:SAM-dependent methyltransferase